MISLADPYLKTIRAKKHLEDLRERFRTFREDYPCSFRREDDIEQQLHIVRFKFKPIPDELPLIFGDCLYCLRSSLDQLVWALAKLTVAYPEGTQFPILEQADPDRFERQTRGVPTDAIAIIDSLQPYHGRDDAAIKSHLLWRLNKLVNIDKHRRIPTDASMVDFSFPNFPKRFLPQVRFDHDAEMAIAPLALKRYMGLDPTGYLDIFFGDSYEGIRCNFEALEQIYTFVAESVLPRFARFF